MRNDLINCLRWRNRHEAEKLRRLRHYSRCRLLARIDGELGLLVLSVVILVVIVGQLEKIKKGELIIVKLLLLRVYRPPLCMYCHSSRKGIFLSRFAHQDYPKLSKRFSNMLV